MRLFRASFCLLLLSLFAQGAAGRDDDHKAKTKASSEKHALEKDLAKTLTGAALVGRFTIDGRPEGNSPHTDRYEIDKAEKVLGNRWLIVARVKYGKNDLKVPIPLEIYWAGDTPVITVTKLTIPALGTFTSRVMIYGDRYAGTWQHDAIGGHMWGHIERGKSPAPKTSL